jgi:hypothetical protein
MAELDKYIIDDFTDPAIYKDPIVDGSRVTRGLIPRMWQVHGPGYLDGIPAMQSVNVPLIPRSEWSDRIKERQQRQSTLRHLRDNAQGTGKRMESLDQNGQGFCWAYAAVAALMLSRMGSNMPYKRLSAHMVGCLVKGYKDEGGWGALALDFMMKNGVADVDSWREKSMSRSNDTPAMRENAKLYMPQETLVDLQAPVYDRDLSWDQLVSCLLQNFPVAGDFLWWGHAVACLDVIEIERNDFGILILNSWSDRWNADSPYGPGTSVLRGNKARPDNAVAICSAVAS